MEAAALFERVLRVSLPQLEFRFSSRQKAGYGVTCDCPAKKEETMTVSGHDSALPGRLKH